MKRLAVVALAIAFIGAVACGGNDGDKGDTRPTPTASVADVASTPAPPTAARGASGSGGDGKFVVVTIGDQRYEFDLSGGRAICVSIGGAIGGNGWAADGSEVSVDIDLPPDDWESRPSSEGWDAPYLRVRDDDNEIDWRAGDVIGQFSGVEAGESQVDSFAIDGLRASGTATFIDLTALQRAGAGLVDRPEPVTGTFEISCGG